MPYWFLIHPFVRARIYRKQIVPRTEMKFRGRGKRIQRQGVNEYTLGGRSKLVSSLALQFRARLFEVGKVAIWKILHIIGSCVNSKDTNTTISMFELVLAQFQWNSAQFWGICGVLVLGRCPAVQNIGAACQSYASFQDFIPIERHPSDECGISQYHLGFRVGCGHWLQFSSACR